MEIRNHAAVRRARAFRNLSSVIDLIIGFVWLRSPLGARAAKIKAFSLNSPQITQNDDYSNDHSRYFIHIDHFGNIIFIILTLSLSSLKCIYKSLHCTSSFRRVFLCHLSAHLMFCFITLQSRNFRRYQSSSLFTFYFAFILLYGQRVE